MECAYSFHPISADEVFLPISQKMPIRTSSHELGRVVWRVNTSNEKIGCVARAQGR